MQANVQTLSVRLGAKRVFWACITLLELAYAGAIGLGALSQVCLPLRTRHMETYTGIVSSSCETWTSVHKAFISALHAICKPLCAVRLTESSFSANIFGL